MHSLYPVETIRFLKKGTSGPPVLLLHGWGCSSHQTRSLAQLLSSKFQVFALDLPGFGGSPPPEKAWGSEEYAQCITQWARCQGVHSAHLVGHSVGGRIALRIAEKTPGFAQSLTLLAASGLQRRRTMKERRRFLGVKSLGFLTKQVDRYWGTHLFPNWFSPRFASADYQLAGALRSTLVKLVQEDLTVQAKKVNTPTLILWGEEDRETPVEMAHRFGRLIAHSSVYTFPGLGHQLLETASDHLCARYILRFLDPQCGASYD